MKTLTALLTMFFLAFQLTACGGGGGGSSGGGTTPPSTVTGLAVPAQVPVVTPNN